MSQTGNEYIRKTHVRYFFPVNFKQRELLRRLEKRRGTEFNFHKSFNFQEI